MSKNLVLTRKALLLESIHGVAEESLIAAGFEVDTFAGALQGEELIAKALPYSFLGIRSKTQMTEQVLSGLPNLRALGAFCIGTNQVDLVAANGKGLPVFNAPYSNTRSVAELVMGELVMLSRRLGDLSHKAHQGIWKKSAVGARELRGKVLGIVGYGHIGSQVSILAEAFGIKVVYYDVVKKLTLGNAQALASFDEVVKVADFLSFHVPQTAETQGMMTAEQIGKMKKGAYLINASRGTVVDIDGLVQALKDGHLAGAAIDVFPKEPGNNSETFYSELRGLENVILTPHIGGSTEEAQKSIGGEVAESFCQFATQGSTLGAVSLPMVEVPDITNEFSRIFNIHKNVPGVLGEINSIISGAEGNIRRQFLTTDPNIGVVVIDLGRGDVVAISEKIRTLKTSLHTYIVSQKA